VIAGNWRGTRFIKPFYVFLDFFIKKQLLGHEIKLLTNGHFDLFLSLHNLGPL
jgi:hypothetical protein